MRSAIWRKVTLNDIKSEDTDAIARGPLPSELLRTDYTPFGIPVIRTNNLGLGEKAFYCDDQVVFVSGKKAKELAAFSAKPDDLIFSTQNFTGQLGLVPHDLPWSEFLLSHNLFKLRCNLRLVNPKFLYYYFCSPPIRSALHQILAPENGSPITLEAFQQISVRLPDLPEQIRITQILADFDERIELNKQINSTLEQLILALFRAWFVDFEPVLANQTGIPHSTTDTPIAALFPDNFTLNNMGRIPAGWNWRSLVDYGHYVQGAVFRKSDFCSPKEGLPVVKLAELRWGFSPRTSYSNTGTREEQRINTGDILFAWSGISDASLGVKLWTGGPAWLHHHIFRVIPPSPIQRIFIYCLLKQVHPILIQSAHKSQTFGLAQITQKDLQQILVVAPPPKLIEHFCRLCEPMFARIIHNDIETQTLIKSRTSLLMPLMQGNMFINSNSRP